MQSFTVIPGFYILKNDECCLLFICELMLVYTFSFKCFKEAFCNCIVPAISFSAHAPSNMGICFQKTPEFIAGILNSPVRMKDKFPSYRTSFSCHFKRRYHCINCFHRQAQCPAYYFSITKVFYRGQVQPPLFGSDVSDVTLMSSFT